MYQHRKALRISCATVLILAVVSFVLQSSEGAGPLRTFLALGSLVAPVSFMRSLNALSRRIECHSDEPRPG